MDEFEYLDDIQLKVLRKLKHQWNDACRDALEHNTPENNHKADVLAGMVAGYVAPLLSMLDAISKSSDVGELFDGHDELNEDTHEANEQLLTGALDCINAITRGKYED